MPVDLSAIPDVAIRKRPPLLKRWLVVLLIFFVFSGLLTSWLWPAHKTTHGALFWHCFITVPLVMWTLLLGLRWLFYLSAVWPADGWDEEREQDIAYEIQRGQRYLLLEEVAVHLPHVVTSGTLTHQFLLPQGVILPAVVNENTQAVAYHAGFDDGEPTLSDRVLRRVKALLDDRAIQSALSHSYAARPLSVIIQISCESELNKEDIKGIYKCISPLLPVSSKIQFLPKFGLTEIDSWLDAPDSFPTLLILSVNVLSLISDGEGEAAVALLLRFGVEDASQLTVAHVHRPELAKDTTAIHESAIQALHWGKTCCEDIAALWLAGMGVENKTQALLANNNLKFPRAEASAQLTDIDMKSGYTGVASPWLAIALAAGNVGVTPYPQLIMSMANRDAQPWWMVVYPPSLSQA